MDELRFDASKGLCRGEPTDWWFPVVTDKETIANARAAIQICKQCPIIKQCLNYALRNEGFGIWGGMTEREREVERRRQKIQLNPSTTLVRSKAATTVARQLAELSDDEIG
jgi:WhiB family redox-sensing transcriptional regulator